MKRGIRRHHGKICDIIEAKMRKGAEKILEIDKISKLNWS